MTRRALLLAVPLGTILLALWAGVITFGNTPYIGAELLSSGTVHFVDPDGPADRAGLRLGDYITTVDGRPLLATLNLLSGRSPGDRVAFSGYRGGEPIRADVVLDDVTNREQIFSYERLFVGLIFWIVGLGIWMMRPELRAARLFFVFSQLMAGMFFAEILDPAVPSMSVLTDFTRYLLAPLLLHFFASFPRPIAEPYRTWLLGAVYAGYAVVATIHAAALIFSLDLYQSGLWLTPRVFEVIVGVLLVAVLLRPQPTASLNAHRWRGILVTGMLLGIFPVMLTLMSMVVSGGRPLIPYEWTIPALALTPLSYGYAVYKSELGKAGFILNRSLVYLLLTGMLLGVYALLYLGFDAFMPTERGWGHLMSGVLIVLGGSALFVPIRNRLQHWVDRFFYGGWYDYRSFVQSVSADLSRFTDLRDLTNQLKTAAETMRFQNGAFLWPRAGRFAPVGGYGLNRGHLRALNIPIKSRVVGALREIGEPCSQDDLRTVLEGEHLSESERALLERAEFKYWMPLTSRGTLRSIIVAGPRHGMEELDSDDRAILATLSTQAAIACDNIALLESLQERLAEVERVRDELAEAQTRLTEGREDERMHLARELHDGPVQDLYAMLHEVEMLAAGGDELDLSMRLSPWRETVQRVAGTLRDICVELRPPLLSEFGLDVAIRSYAGRFAERYPGLDLKVHATPAGEELPERVQLALFRICQEALNNAAQHARARQLRIRFEADAESILLEIDDDGRGFVVPKRWIEFARRGHLGLMGIAERAKSIGGSLQVSSKPGKGTQIRVQVPRSDDIERPSNPSTMDLIEHEPDSNRDRG